jgi:hypothetical protein
VLDCLTDRYVEQVGLSHRQFCARHRVISQKVGATNWLNKWLTSAGFQVQIIALVRYIIIIITDVDVEAYLSGCTKGLLARTDGSNPAGGWDVCLL